jgi:hypothetical protein
MGDWDEFSINQANLLITLILSFVPLSIGYQSHWQVAPERYYAWIPCLVAPPFVCAPAPPASLQSGSVSGEMGALAPSPLTGGLPSIPIAPCGLFGDFSGTIPPSDCLRPFIIGLRPWTSQRSPVYIPGRRGLPQFPCKLFPSMYRVSDCAELLPVA